MKLFQLLWVECAVNGNKDLSSYSIRVRVYFMKDQFNVNMLSDYLSLQYIV